MRHTWSFPALIADPTAVLVVIPKIVHIYVARSEVPTPLLHGRSPTRLASSGCETLSVILFQVLPLLKIRATRTREDSQPIFTHPNAASPPIQLYSGKPFWWVVILK